jgi:hypothetical protein
MIQEGSDMETIKGANKKNKREDAVSEAIGFILIFSLVMVGIGLITLYGYPILLEQQSNANVKNMERDMIVLQNDMKSLVYKNVPYKETSLQVSGGSLAVHSYSEAGSSFKIEVSGSDSAIPEINYNLTEKGLSNVMCGQLRYESDAGESIISLENGAVVIRMEFQEGSVMLAEPRWFVDINPQTDDKTMIITLINISSDSPMSRNGIGTVKMKMVNSEFYTSPPLSGMTVKVTYDENTKYNFSKAWYNFLTDGNTVGMEGSGGVFIRDSINTLVVKRYDIKIISI